VAQSQKLWGYFRKFTVKYNAACADSFCPCAELVTSRMLCPTRHIVCQFSKWKQCQFSVSWTEKLRLGLCQNVTRQSLGDRAFCVTAARAWNTLTPSVQSSESLTIFRCRLKTELFSRSFPDWLYQCLFNSFVTQFTTLKSFRL